MRLLSLKKIPAMIIWNGKKLSQKKKDKLRQLSKLEYALMVHFG